jgi:membrane-associated protein
MPAELTSLSLNVLDPHSLLSTLGAAGVFLVLFAETGLLVGFFLPGDSLLFTAGLLCTTGSETVHLSLLPVLGCASAGALLGAQTGFVLGRIGGPVLLHRAKRPVIHTAAARAEATLARYGQAKAIVLARFIPLVRTVLNPLAGALGVPTRTFTTWQVVGGLAWSIGVTSAGYGLGSRISGIDTYLLPIIAAVVAVSLVPVVAEIRRQRRSSPTPTVRTGGEDDASPELA